MNTPSSHSNTNHGCLTDYAKADRRLQMGKRLVITGFFVALIGVILYCVVPFSIANQPLRATVQADMGWPVVVSLGMVGVGTLLWIVGAIVYFIGGVDSDPSGPDLYF